MFALGLLLSIGIGLSLGLLGGGGSILTVPLLHYVLGVPAHDAISASLIVVGLTSAAALLPHARAGRVQWQYGLVLGGASMLGAYGGGRLNAFLPARLLIVAFALLMIAAGITMLVRGRRPLRAPTRPDLATFLAIGLGVGVLTGILGAGGGFIIVPALVIAGGLAMREAVGTSLLVIAMNAFAALAGTASHAHVDAGIVAPVAGLAVLGCVGGVRFGRHLSANQLQRGFAGFVIVTGLVIAVYELVI
jgi:uncharacterized membrane protein YfcA